MYGISFRRRKGCHTFNVAMALTKCLEFRLPTGAAGWASGMAKQKILKVVKIVADEHHLTYTSKTEGYRLKVFLEDDSLYTFFLLVWPEKTEVWMKPELVNQ
jgi:hypothetical protein